MLYCRANWLKRVVALAVCGINTATLCAAGSEKEISLTTQDSWTLSAVYLPAQPEKRTVVLLHDLGKSKEAFAAFRAALAKAGIGYLALDLRGYGKSTGGGVASSFAREGVDNQFNKMTRDVDAAMEFLQKQGVTSDQIALLGAGLGANVAAKSVTFWPDTALLALISPTVNVRDVLVIPALRLYKNNELIAAGAADRKMFLEASVIRNVAYLATGPENGQITFLTAYDKTSHDMLDQYLTPAVIQWIKTPKRPEVASGEVVLEEEAQQPPQEGLVPSVLE
ncbi:MAG: lysophospholipase [Elusimicrobiaceae bacterium]|nr:lysophospholipase [Elusimicrobiaceae bacterium]